MTTSTLLSFPEELLIKILLYLSPSDFLAIQLTSRYLNTTINNSVVLQYQALLNAVQYTDNPFSPLSIPDRLTALKKREEAWVSLRPTFTKEIEVEHDAFSVAAISGGVYLSSEKARRCLFWVKMADQEDDKQVWRIIDMGPGLSVLDVGLCIYEHDLIAVVTTSPHPSMVAMHTTQLHLLQLSDFALSHPIPHPLASQNALHILDSPHDRPRTSIQIVGDHLVLILFVPLARDEPDVIFVYNWRSGYVIARFNAPHGSYYDFVFLTEHWFLLPNAKEGTLDIYEIPPHPRGHVDGSIGIELIPIHILALPALMDAHFVNIICSGKPNPVGEGHMKLHTTIPCYPRPEDAIITFNFHVRRIEPLGRFAIAHAFSMYVHRRALLEVCRRQSLSQSPAPSDANQSPSSDPTPVSPPPRIPYRSWGPPIARWLDVDEIVFWQISTTAGQRAVLISQRAYNDSAPYIVLDFNQENVRRAKKALGYCDEEVSPSESGRGPEVDCSGSTEMDDENDENEEGSESESENWEDEDADSDSFDTDGGERLNAMRGRTIGLQGVPPEYASVLPPSSSLIPSNPHMHTQADNANPDTNEEHPPSQPPTDPNPLPFPNRWLTTGFHAVRHSDFFDPSEKPVGGSLPYLACSSAKRYNWDGVMIDGERVLGTWEERPVPRLRKLQMDFFG